ncbi:uncharacterized protein G2W53_026583 [Senna tora]|uniref:Uncharacterized protein n=1 Tax=Senna tora TaxID=362788 RepID=A0A834TFA0_9FABA|nr:uncharacterized protein G2W53_026583 [Senna tora]
MVGGVIQLDPLNDKEDNLQALRVKVMLDSEKDCNWSVIKSSTELQWQRINFYNKFGVFEQYRGHPSFTIHYQNRDPDYNQRKSKAKNDPHVMMAFFLLLITDLKVKMPGVAGSKTGVGGKRQVVNLIQYNLGLFGANFLSLEAGRSYLLLAVVSNEANLLLWIQSQDEYFIINSAVNIILKNSRVLFKKLCNLICLDVGLIVGILMLYYGTSIWRVK